MANQNLSQFTEKPFVADADHTFIWDTAASISKRVSRNSWLNSGTLTSDAPVTISQTWNNAAVAFTGLKFNAAGTSGTNSASGSLLADFQLNGVSQASVNKSGNLTVVGYLAANGGNSFLSGTTLRIGNSNGDINLSGGSLIVPSTTAFGWANTLLVRDGADNTLALRNGAGVPQTFRVYNTFLGTTANEWFEIDWKTSAGTVRLFTMHGGTGVARNIDISAGGTLYFGAGTSSPIRMYSNGVERWNISTTGHFIAAADNTYDIGASGANRPRNVYVASQLAVGTFATFGSYIYAENYYFSTTKGLLAAPSDGVFTFSNRAATDFNRLQFGGTTNLFPAIKRSTVRIQAVLANDSGFTNIQGKLTTDTDFTATVVTPTGFLTLYDAQGNAYKVPCVPA